jgi:hypothetical protein
VLFSYGMSRRLEDTSNRFLSAECYRLVRLNQTLASAPLSIDIPLLPSSIIHVVFGSVLIPYFGVNVYHIEAHREMKETTPLPPKWFQRLLPYLDNTETLDKRQERTQWSSRLRQAQ